MPTETEALRSDCRAAARAVRRRLALVAFARSLRASHLAVGGVALLAVVALRRLGEWRTGEWIVVAALLALWLGVSWLVAAAGRPGTEKALRLLDRRGGWKDCFSSAWDFLKRAEPGEAERLHLSRAAAALPGARRRVRELFAPPSLGAVWAAPLLALGFGLLPWGRVAPDARDLALSEGMAAAAAAQAEALRREAAKAGELDALTEEERTRLDALRAEVDELAQDLADAEGLTAGEALDSLEARARAAERLAEQLGGADGGWASEAMLAEMGRHPDTADLALFLKDKAAEGAAAESGSLAAALADEAITAETQERFTRSLESVAGAATEEDKARPVGERFGNAARKLIDAQPRTAAREFEELAKFFLELARREEARRKLEELAETLREAGGEIAGSELERMEEMAGEAAPRSPAPQGLQALDAPSPGTASEKSPGDPLAAETAEGAPALAASPAGPPQEGPAPVPGAVPGQGERGGSKEKGEQTFAAPVPGEKAPEGQTGSGLGMSDRARDGKGEGGMLSAPIPGMPPGESVPGQGAGMKLGASASSQAGQGGDEAGAGTAAMAGTASDLLKASGDAKVAARAGREGESSVRAVEGQAKAEPAKRSRQEVVSEFIAVEEQALDDQALPLSRRQQVLRYFSGIRAQFETGEGR